MLEGQNSKKIIKSKKSSEEKSAIAPMQYLFGIAWDLIP